MTVRLVRQHWLLLKIAVEVALLHVQCMDSSVEGPNLLLEGPEELASSL